jgi:hypothetical protein
MSGVSSKLGGWTPDQVAQGRRWVLAWRLAGEDLAKIRRNELRAQDAFQAIAHLCGPADYRVPPRSPRPTSGLVEQQRWFQKARLR